MATVGQLVEKRAAEEEEIDFPSGQVLYGKRKNKPIRSLVERVLYGDVQGANEKTYKDVSRMLELMRKSNPGELKDTAVMVGRPSLDNILNQVAATQHHDTGVSDFFGDRDMMSQQLSFMTDSGLEQFPTSYFPMGDMAVIPEGSTGAAMHELGHAIDLNRNLDKGHKYRRDWRLSLKPTLLKELAAWSKGSKSLAGGLLEDGKKEKDEALVREILGDAYQRRGPALGTYFGGTSGALLGGLGGVGIPLALGSDDPGLMTNTGILGAVLGGILGVPLGGLLGRGLTTEKGEAKYAEKVLARAARDKEKRDLKLAKKGL